MRMLAKILFIIVDIILAMVVIYAICKYLGVYPKEAFNFFKPLIDEMGNILKMLKGIGAQG